MVDTIDTVYRDYVTAGVPGSGDYEPEKPKIRKLLKAIASGGVVVPTYRGAWSGATTYNEGDAVASGGSLWIADRTNTNVTPVDGADWSLFLAGSSVADGSLTDIKFATPADISAGLRSGKVRYNLSVDPGFKYRSVPDRLQEKISVKDFGAIGDGVSHPLSSITTWNGISTVGYTLAQWQAIFPHATALTNELDWCASQAAINWAGNTTANPSGGTVNFPRGRYFMSATLIVPFDNVCLMGQGRLSSVLYRTSATYGDTVAIAKVGDAGIRGSGVQSLGFESRGTEMTSGSHLRLRAVQDALFMDLNLDSGYNGLSLEGCGRCTFIAIICTHQFGNNGNIALNIAVSTVTSNPIPTDLHFYGFDLQPLNNSFPYDYGIVVSCADGVYFTNCHWNLADTALYINQGGSNNLSGLLFTGCWFDTCNTRSVLIDGTTALQRFNYDFVNCVFRGNSSGVVATIVELAGNSSLINFTACEFRWSRRSCISIGADTSYVTISGCKFVENNLDNSSSASIIVVLGDAASITSCIFNGAMTTGQGINIGASASGYLVVGNNMFGLGGILAAAKILDGGSGAKVVANNLI